MPELPHDAAKLSTAGSNAAGNLQRPLSYADRYDCPICRHGEIAAMTLMDAYACNFCRHIFTANLTEQVLRVEDSATQMAWRWNGRAWRNVRWAEGNQDLTTLVWVFCLGLMVLPPVMVWLPMQIFPPLEGSSGAWFPMFWLVMAIVAHGVMGVWLLAEHYQWGFYVISRERLGRLFAAE